VRIDESQQVVFRNLIFQTEVIEQRLGAVVLPHHYAVLPTGLPASMTKRIVKGSILKALGER